MKTDYARSVNNWFKDYPRTFKLTCGPNIQEFGGPWMNGSQLILSQTPLSKIHQGPYLEGAHLPDFQVIYTNTGDDDLYQLKYKEYGWGSFLSTLVDPNYFLQVEKFCELWSGYNGIVKVFKKVVNYSTQIPKSTNLSGPERPEIDPIPLFKDYMLLEGDVLRYPDHWLRPDQVEDLSFYLYDLIRIYGRWCVPQVSYVVGKILTASYYQIGIQPQFTGWIEGTITLPPWFHQGQWQSEWNLSLVCAPDRPGIYMFWFRFDLLGEGDIYYIKAYLDYAYYVHSILYGGAEMVQELRRACLRERGEF